MNIDKMMEENIELAQERQHFFELLLKLVAIVSKKKLRLVIENPYSGESYLKDNFFLPSIIDKNRMLRGDYFVKPTGYWFFGCTPTYGFTEQRDKKQRAITKISGSHQRGLCGEERSMISPDYARNFICDFILGKEQVGTQLQLF